MNLLDIWFVFFVAQWESVLLFCIALCSDNPVVNEECKSFPMGEKLKVRLVIHTT
jgi:hypothetical protein